MTDWNKIADTLSATYRLHGNAQQPQLDAAITLCRRMAAGEVVERSEVFTRDMMQSAMNFGRGQGIAEAREQMADVAMSSMTQPIPEPAPAETAPQALDEREHCERVVRLYNQHAYPSTNGLVGFVARERAAADKAGYERGRAELEKAALAARLDNSAGWRELQSKYDTLSAAVREVHRFVPVCTDLEQTYPGLYDRIKTLASTEANGGEGGGE